MFILNHPVYILPYIVFAANRHILLIQPRVDETLANASQNIHTYMRVSGICDEATDIQHARCWGWLGLAAINIRRLHWNSVSRDTAQPLSD